jgi:ribosomal-protein-alanine N-acetyltransferase
MVHLLDRKYMYEKRYNSIQDLKLAHVLGDLCESSRFKMCILSPDYNNVTNYLNWMIDRESNQFILGIDPAMTPMQLNKYVLEKYSSDNSLLLGIFVLDTNEHIGNIKFEPIDILRSTAEVGILVGEKNWRNRGVASEVLVASLSCLNRSLDIKAFELGVNKANIAALKAYSKVGFVPLGSEINSDTIRMRYSFL